MATKIDPYQPGRSSRFYAGAMNLMQTGAEMQSAAIAGRYQAASAAIGAIGSSVTAALQANTQMKLGMLKLHHDSSIERAKLDVEASKLEMDREAARLMGIEAEGRMKLLEFQTDKARLDSEMTIGSSFADAKVADAVKQFSVGASAAMAAGRPLSAEETSRFQELLAGAGSHEFTAVVGDRQIKLMAQPSGQMAEAHGRALEALQKMSSIQVGERVYSAGEVRSVFREGSPARISAFLQAGDGVPALESYAREALRDRNTPEAARVALQYWSEFRTVPDASAFSDPTGATVALDQMRRDVADAEAARNIGVAPGSPVVQTAGGAALGRAAAAIAKTGSQYRGAPLSEFARGDVSFRPAVDRFRSVVKPEQRVAFDALLASSTLLDVDAVKEALGGLGADPKETAAFASAIDMYRTSVDAALSPELSSLMRALNVSDVKGATRAIEEGWTIRGLGTPDAVAVGGGEGFGKAGAVVATIAGPIGTVLGLGGMRALAAGGRFLNNPGSARVKDSAALTFDLLAVEAMRAADANDPARLQDVFDFSRDLLAELGSSSVARQSNVGTPRWADGNVSLKAIRELHMRFGPDAAKSTRSPGTSAYFGVDTPEGNMPPPRYDMPAGAPPVAPPAAP